MQQQRAYREETEREVLKLKKAEYMQKRIGEEYEGVISGVTKWGVYVELPNTIEGLVHVADMKDDHYELAEERYELVGEHTGKTYKLGQKVMVRVTDADRIQRRSILRSYRGWVIMGKTEKKLIANNKKAYHDYFILEKYEAGIVLHGTEVKSLRMGKCSIKESFIRVEDGEMFIYGMHISPYEKGNIINKDPLRVKNSFSTGKRLIRYSKDEEQGITVVPLQVYFSGSLVKVEIGLAKGKKLYDKRADIAKKDQKSRSQREFKVRNL